MSCDNCYDLKIKFGRNILDTWMGCKDTGKQNTNILYFLMDIFASGRLNFSLVLSKKNI